MHVPPRAALLVLTDTSAVGQLTLATNTKAALSRRPCQFSNAEKTCSVELDHLAGNRPLDAFHIGKPDAR